MNKSIIITGASGGLGKELAFAFSKKSYSIGLIARRTKELEKTKTICLEYGAKSVFIETVDISDSTKQRDALLSLINKLKGVDVFIANAGVSCIQKPLQDNGTYIRKAIETNFLAAADGIEFVRTKMMEQNHGTIVGITSVAQAKGMPLNGTYCATKAALHIFLQGLRLDLAKTPIKIIEVAPGFVDTEMTKKNKFYMPFLIRSDLAAKTICDKIISNKKLIILPAPFIVLFYLIKWIPNFFYEWVVSRKNTSNLY